MATVGDLFPGKGGDAALDIAALKDLLDVRLGGRGVALAVVECLVVQVHELVGRLRLLAEEYLQVVLHLPVRGKVGEAKEHKVPALRTGRGVRVVAQLLDKLAVGLIS